LGTLDIEESRRVERHLDWCPGCRKEFAELQEGLTPIALSLVPLEPPRQLEERVVARLLTAAGRWKTTSRQGVRALVAATLAAVLVALGALGWAVAERQNAADVKNQAADRLAQAQDFAHFLQSVGATPYFSTLRPTSQISDASGTVVVYSARRVQDFVLAQLVLPAGKGSSYTFELTDRDGGILSGGKLTKTNNANTWLFLDRTGRNLSRGVNVLVLDASESAVLTGVMKPAAASPAP
jgi:Putative zinc-finger